MDRWENLLASAENARAKGENARTKKARAQTKKARAKAILAATYGLCIDKEDVSIDYTLLAQHDAQKVPKNVRHKLGLTQSQFDTVAMLNRLPRRQKEGLATTQSSTLRLYKTPEDLARAFLVRNLVTC